MRKVLPSAVLKNLPEEKQDAIWEKLNTPLPETGKRPTIAAIVKWLRDDGIQTSSTAVSYWREWYPSYLNFRRCAITADAIKDEIKQLVPSISDAELDEMGQKAFSLAAIKDQDADTFVKVRSSRTKAIIEAEKLKIRQAAEARLQEQANLARVKWQRETIGLYLKWLTDKQSQEIAAKPISNEAKIEELGRHHFGELWHLHSAAQ